MTTFVKLLAVRINFGDLEYILEEDGLSECGHGPSELTAPPWSIYADPT